MTGEQYLCIQGMKKIAQQFQNWNLDVKYPFASFQGEEFFSVLDDGLLNCTFRIDPGGFTLSVTNGGGFSKFCRENYREIYTPSFLRDLFLQYVQQEHQGFINRLKELESAGSFINWGNVRMKIVDTFVCQTTSSPTKKVIRFVPEGFSSADDLESPIAYLRLFSRGGVELVLGTVKDYREEEMCGETWVSFEEFLEKPSDSIPAEIVEWAKLERITVSVAPARVIEFVDRIEL